MSNTIMVEVNARDSAGKNAARRVRHAGQIPGVVYGGGREPVAVTLDPRPVEAILDTEKGLNTLIQLRLAGRDLRRMVMLREVQRHPVTERLMHVDFYRVELDQTVDVEVPIVLIGSPIGVREEGGLVTHINRQVTVRVLPANIPEHFEVDVTELHVGQHVEASELTMPAGVTLLSPPTETIVTVVSKAVEEPKPVEEAEAIEAEGAEAEAEKPGEPAESE